MATGDKHLRPLRRRLQALLNAERSRMRWELGHFQTPMFVREPGKTPTKPYMLVCIDTASRFLLASDLLLDAPVPQDFLSLIVSSMETRGVEGGAPVVPESVRLSDSAVCKLLDSELGQLGVKLELVEHLPALAEFKGIAEREFFSRQRGYSGGKN
jgi:Domain of unknown function (DUF6930)